MIEVSEYEDVTDDEEEEHTTSPCASSGNSSPSLKYAIPIAALLTDEPSSPSSDSSSPHSKRALPIIPIPSLPPVSTPTQPVPTISLSINANSAILNSIHSSTRVMMMQSPKKSMMRIREEEGEEAEPDDGEEEMNQHSNRNSYQRPTIVVEFMEPSTVNTSPATTTTTSPAASSASSSASSPIDQTTIISAAAMNSTRDSSPSFNSSSSLDSSRSSSPLPSSTTPHDLALDAFHVLYATQPVLLKYCRKDWLGRSGRSHKTRVYVDEERIEWNWKGSSTDSAPVTQEMNQLMQQMNMTAGNGHTRLSFATSTSTSTSTTSTNKATPSKGKPSTTTNTTTTNDSSPRFLLWSDIISIHTGLHTSVLSSLPPSKADFCFSLITADRTLDLEAETVMECSVWYRGMLAYWQEWKMRHAAASARMSNSGSVSQPAIEKKE